MPTMDKDGASAKDLLREESLTSEIDAAAVVRFIAVVLIVAGHIGALEYGGGGAYSLMLLAGLTYSKYIVPKFGVPGEAARKHFSLLLKIGLPTSLYLFLLHARFSPSIDWYAVFLMSNFIGPRFFAAWFIEVYVQINILLLLAGLVPKTRVLLASLGNFKVALGFFLLAVVVGMVSSAAWDASHLYGRLPDRMLWMFAAGVQLGACSTALQRTAFAGLTLMTAALMLGPGQVPPFFVAAVLFLGATESLRMGRPAFLVTKFVSGASLMIYLTHFQAARLLEKPFPSTSAWALVVLALAVGVLVQVAYNWTWQGVVRSLHWPRPSNAL